MPGRQPALPWPPRSSGAGQAGAFSGDLLKYSAPFPLRSRAGSGRLLLVSACRGLSRPWGAGLDGPCSGLGATVGSGGAVLRPGTLVTAASVGQRCSSPWTRRVGAHCRSGPAVVAATRVPAHLGALSSLPAAPWGPLPHTAPSPTRPSGGSPPVRGLRGRPVPGGCWGRQSRGAGQGTGRGARAGAQGRGLGGYGLNSLPNAPDWICRIQLPALGL